MSVKLVGTVNAAVGAVTDIHTEAKVAVGTRMRGDDGNEYIYLKGVASTVAGFWVTYDEAGVTTALVINAIGPVAVAMAATVAATWGWYCVDAPVGVLALVAANSADNTTIGRETTDGYAGDGRAAGDEILNCIARGATAGAAALTTVQFSYPFVNDKTGS